MRLKDKKPFLEIVDRLMEIGITQSKIAINIGVSQQKIADIRAGRGAVYQSYMDKIREVYWFLDGPKVDPETQKENSLLMQDIVHLQRENRELKQENEDLKNKIEELENK